jgi:opacity protein-like surface antigen
MSQPVRSTRSSARRRLAGVVVATVTAVAALLAPAPAQAAPGQVTVHFYEGYGEHDSWTHTYGPKFTMWVNVTGCRSGSVDFIAWDPTKQPPTPPNGVGLIRGWWSLDNVGTGVYSKYSAAQQKIRYRFGFGTSASCHWRIRVTEYRDNVPS